MKDIILLMMDKMLILMILPIPLGLIILIAIHMMDKVVVKITVLTVTHQPVIVVL
jgi:hypothetical protein